MKRLGKNSSSIFICVLRQFKIGHLTTGHVPQVKVYLSLSHVLDKVSLV